MSDRNRHFLSLGLFWFCFCCIWLLTACSSSLPPLPTPVPRAVQIDLPATAVSDEPTASTNLPNINPAHLNVFFIDVGQGDSIFIQTPSGHTALIDGGYDNGLALAFLQSLGIEAVDTLIVSHPHADHIGGLVAVLQAMPIGSIWTSGASHNTEIYEQLLDVIAEKQVPYYEVAPGDIIPLGDLSLAVLYGQSEAANLNDTSLVLKLEYDHVSFLFTGDAESGVERILLQIAPHELAATILKVAHHGSSDSSSLEFLTAVQPELAIYSAGRGNQYGHPHGSTLDNLQAVGAEVLGTAEQGTILVSSDGRHYEVETEVNWPVALWQVTKLQPTPPSGATATYEPFGRDRNCSAFATQAEAQAFFIAAGGPNKDPHRLDGDGDDIACEDLP